MYMALALLLQSAAEIGDLIDRLADRDVEVREAATRRLIEIGEPAWEEVRKASESGDPEVASRARHVLEEISLLRVALKIGVPDRRKPGEQIPFTITLRNDSLRKISWFPEGLEYEVTLLEVFEDPPLGEERFSGGGWYRASSGCRLSEGDFRTLASRKEAEAVTADLLEARLRISPELRKKHPKIDCEKPGIRGRYRITASYAYDPAEYKKRCRKNCPGHDDTRKAWNQCYARPLRAEREFEIR
jgi:hypothetical protein